MSTDRNKHPVPTHPKVKDLVQRLRRARIERNWDQQTIATQIGKSRPWVSMFETATLDPSLSDVLAMGDLLDVDILVASRADSSDPGIMVEAAVEADPHLTPEARGVILAAYRAARQATGMGQTGRQRIRRPSPFSSVTGKQGTSGTVSVNSSARRGRAS